MSKPLTMETVLERLQEALFDMTDLAAKAGNEFKGAVFDDVAFLYRENDPSFWRITVEPIVGYTQSGQPLTDRDVESLKPTEVPAEELQQEEASFQRFIQQPEA